MTTNQHPEANIGKHSRITLGVAVATLAVVISAAVGGTAAYYDMRGQVRQIARDQWTVLDQQAWTLELKNANPQLIVPSPAQVALPTNLGAQVDPTNRTMMVAAMQVHSPQSTVPSQAKP